MPYIRNTPIPSQEIDARPEFECFRNIPLWVLFDDNGLVLTVDDNRVGVFFFAAEHEMPVHRLQ